MREAKIPLDLLRGADGEDRCAPAPTYRWNLPRRVVRMPRPFGSISESLGGAMASPQKATPRFLSMGKATSSAKPEPEGRILISEVWGLPGGMRGQRGIRCMPHSRRMQPHAC